MKIAFLYIINPGVFRAVNSPLGIAYIASYLEKHLGITETWIEVDTDELIKSKPDFVGICAYSWSYTRAKQAALKIKQALNVPIILGGPHVSALPHKIDPVFDIGVMGEGEETVAELVQLFQEDKWSPEYFQHVQSVVYLDNGFPKITLKRPVIENLDSLPLPKRSILKAYSPTHQRVVQWYPGLNASRGCPFKCQYCVHSTLLEKVRFHSTGRVIEEVESIIEMYPNRPPTITFHDELFALSKKKLKDLSQAIADKGLEKKTSFNCMTRANVFDEEMAFYMKRMNMELVGFGFESNSQPVIDFLKVGDVTVDDHYRVIKICEKFELNSAAYIIIGSPIETLYNLSETYWFLRLWTPPLMRFDMFCITPFPGNALWNRYVSRGIIHDDLEDWEVLSYKNFIPNKSIFVNERYSEEEFIHACSEFDKLKDRNIQYGIINHRKESFNQYQDQIYPKMSEWLTNTQRVLEITPYRHGLLERYNHPNSRQISPTQIEEVDQEFDYILINHAMERIRNPAHFIQELKQFKGAKIICLFYNSLKVKLISALIATGALPEAYKDFPEIDIWKYYSFYSMSELWSKNGFKLQKAYDVPISQVNQALPSKAEQEYKTLLEVFSKFMDINKALKTYQIHNHIFILEQVQSLKSATQQMNTSSSI